MINDLSTKNPTINDLSTNLENRTHYSRRGSTNTGKEREKREKEEEKRWGNKEKHSKREKEGKSFF